MTRQDWTRAEPILTSALFLSRQEQKAMIESAFVDDAIRRELLDVLRRTARALPTSTSAAAGGTAGVAESAEPRALDPPALPLLAAGQPIADGRFVVVRQLGRGGMGEVYLAHDRTLGNLVALKVLYDAEVREAQHARLCSGHPHIVTMYDVFEGQFGDRPRTVLVMEYIAGTPASRLVDDGPAPLRDAVRWIREATAAMAHAHDRGILHCDLKPANILITPEHGAKVLDFGIGRATFERTSPREPLRGTAEYMAPEQLLERQFSEAGDIYSLGVTLFELVTGRVPFEGHGVEVLLQVVGAEPPRASSLRESVPPALDDLLARALAKEPKDRYRTARAFDRALEAVEHDLTTQTTPTVRPFGARIPPPPGPDLWTYVGRTAQVLVVLTVLGFITSGIMDAGLTRNGAFRQSAFSWPVAGLMTLTAPLALIAVSVIMIAILAPRFRQLARLVGIDSALRRMATRLGRVATSALAQVLLVANVAALVTFLAYYYPLLDALRAFTSGEPGSDISMLGPDYGRVHNSYRQIMTVLLAVFGAGWYRLLRHRRLVGEEDGWPTLVAGALVMTACVVLHAMPHRTLFVNKFEAVRYRGQLCSLVAETQISALLFCPLDNARTRRIDVPNPDLERTGELKPMFEPLGKSAAADADP